MAKIFINTLHLSALMMFLLFISSGLPKVNGQPGPCLAELGEPEPPFICRGLLSARTCNGRCKLRNIRHTGICKPEDNALHCHCYEPCT
ncbi:unnamed protein product [Eruca vesicaria subsp. sativa]|uniref:Defensin-like protein n=1 Tax=Eruca vesicaria subsp. sativa TaxID=29727 RepID=A0ABC8LBT6_ERUVS|nr:unnamed protein product [Eruca vesicaria subsp. sativa]